MFNKIDLLFFCRCFFRFWASISDISHQICELFILKMLLDLTWTIVTTMLMWSSCILSVLSVFLVSFVSAQQDSFSLEKKQQQFKSFKNPYCQPFFIIFFFGKIVGLDLTYKRVVYWHESKFVFVWLVQLIIILKIRLKVNVFWFSRFLILKQMFFPASHLFFRKSWKIRIGIN